MYADTHVTTNNHQCYGGKKAKAEMLEGRWEDWLKLMGTGCQWMR